MALGEKLGGRTSFSCNFAWGESSHHFMMTQPLASARARVRSRRPRLRRRHHHLLMQADHGDTGSPFCSDDNCGRTQEQGVRVLALQYSNNSNSSCALCSVHGPICLENRQSHQFLNSITQPRCMHRSVVRHFFWQLHPSIIRSVARRQRQLSPFGIHLNRN